MSRKQRNRLLRIVKSNGKSAAARGARSDDPTPSSAAVQLRNVRQNQRIGARRRRHSALANIDGKELR
jgi:hypothetical protein